MIDSMKDLKKGTIIKCPSCMTNLYKTTEDFIADETLITANKFIPFSVDIQAPADGDDIECPKCFTTISYSRFGGATFYTERGWQPWEPFKYDYTHR